MMYARPRKYNHISRYQIYRQIIDKDSTYLETANQIFVKESEQDRFHEVLKEEENRLDIISNKYYGSPDFYWVIAMANNFIDPFTVNAGDVIRIPVFNSLFEWDGALYGRV